MFTIGFYLNEICVSRVEASILFAKYLCNTRLTTAKMQFALPHKFKMHSHKIANSIWFLSTSGACTCDYGLFFQKGILVMLTSTVKIITLLESYQLAIQRQVFWGPLLKEISSQYIWFNFYFFVCANDKNNAKNSFNWCNYIT